MAASDVGLLSLNAGEVSRLALARVDLKKLQVACEIQSNFLPRVLGPCELRPGTRQLDRTRNDEPAKLIEFWFDEQTKDLLVLTPGIMRICTDGAFLNRVAVGVTLVNGDFLTDLSGWTGADEPGASSTWLAGGELGLLGTGSNYARRDQQITVVDIGVEHALRIHVTHGIVLLQVGQAAGDNSYIDATLFAGWHSIAFVPTIANCWIRLGANQGWTSTVESIVLEPAGEVDIPTPWAADDLSNIFYDQSQDVIFVACLDVQQQRIERRSQRSWSVAVYQADDGPFRLPNITDITLAPGGLTGNVPLVASRPYFKPSHVGALFQLTHQGQNASATLAAANQFTASVRVSGLKPQRDIALILTGTFVATVTLQQSIGVPGNWTDNASVTSPTSQTFNDGLDNQVIYYRAGIKAGQYTSGTAIATLTYGGSIQVGVGRVNVYTGNTVVQIDVLQDFARTDATADWSEGAWSAYRGWPAALAFHDGRLFQGQGIAIYGSVSDAYASYDGSTIGDAGPIARSITTGGRDGIRWLSSLQRLIAGTAQQEVSIRSDAFDAPLTPTAFVARDCSTRGAARLRALKIDAIGVFVGRDDKRVFKLVFEGQFGDYRAHEMTRLKQEMCDAGVVDVAVQRNPDTRIWFVLADGRCAVCTYDEEEDVAAWTEFVTSGAGSGDKVERVAVLPGTQEDEVYFVVARQFGGTTRRFIELLANRTETQAEILNRTSDCHLVYGGPATNTIAVPHLTGKQVVVWADGHPRVTLAAPVTVDGAGNVTIPGEPVSAAVIGLPYTGNLKTAKLAYGSERGTALTMPKKVARVGLVMANVPWQGLKIGRFLDKLTSLPATYRGRPLAGDEVLIDYDDVPSHFNGGWNPDSRVCLQVSSPYSATIMGLVVDMDVNEPNPPEPPPSRNRG
jgi:hypothetical protein